MVSQKVLVKDKWRNVKRVLKVLIVLVVIGIILFGVFFSGFFVKKPVNQINQIVLENPLKNIVFVNTNEKGEVNKEKVIEEGILEFNEEYINYILIALGVGNLHKSLVYGNPVVKFALDDEILGSELTSDGLKTTNGDIDNEDLKIMISKKQAVEALLAPDIENFMKDSVRSGNTQIEIIAGKVELASKGYLGMYKKLTGEEIEGETELSEEDLENYSLDEIAEISE